MLAVFFGIIFIAAGFWGISRWYGEFFVVMKGLMPFMIVMGGLIAVVAGVMDISESHDAKSNEEKEPEQNAK